MATKAYFKLMQNQMSNPLKVQEKISDNLLTIDNDSNIPNSQKQILKTYFGSLNNLLSDSGLMNDTNENSSASPFGSPDITMESVTRDVDMPHKSFEITFPHIDGIISCGMVCTAVRAQPLPSHGMIAGHVFKFKK